MVEKLVLVRHGDAEFYGPEGTDLSRRLTKSGKKALRKAYPATFAQLRNEPAISLWVSPAVRALQTAAIVANALGVDPDAFDLHESLYDQDDDEFLAELEAEGEGCVVAVGHVPFVQRLAFELTGEDLPFSKGSMAVIAFADGDLRRGVLEDFVRGPE